MKTSKPFDSLPVSRREALVAGGALLGGLIVGSVVTQEMNPSQPPAYESASNLKPEGFAISARWMPETILYHNDLISSMAERYNVNANFIGIIMLMESGGWSRAESQAGARGLMQITDTTAGDIASMHLQEPVEAGSYDLFDPATNVEFGAAYINWLRNQIVDFKPDIRDDMLAESIAYGYNGGLVGQAYPYLRGEGVPAEESRRYGRLARGMYMESNAENSPTLTDWEYFDSTGGQLVARAEAEQA